jgi:hypothetical protein
MRGWNANDTFGTYTVNNIKNAQAAGYNSTQIQLYMTPCGSELGAL